MHGSLSKGYILFDNCNVFLSTETACSEGQKEKLIHQTAIFHLHEFRSSF